MEIVRGKNRSSRTLMKVDDARIPMINFGRVIPRQMGTGIMRGEHSLGDQRLLIDSSNQRIVMSDGDNNRLLIGKDKDGDYVVAISKPGEDVLEV